MAITKRKLKSLKELFTESTGGPSTQKELAKIAKENMLQGKPFKDLSFKVWTPVTKHNEFVWAKRMKEYNSLSFTIYSLFVPDLLARSLTVIVGNDGTIQQITISSGQDLKDLITDGNYLTHIKRLISLLKLPEIKDIDDDLIDLSKLPKDLSNMIYSLGKFNHLFDFQTTLEQEILEKAKPFLMHVDKFLKVHPNIEVTSKHMERLSAEHTGIENYLVGHIVRHYDFDLFPKGKGVKSLPDSRSKDIALKAAEDLKKVGQNLFGEGNVEIDVTFVPLRREHRNLSGTITINLYISKEE